VLLVGNDPENIPRSPIHDSICIAKYASYSKLFPRSSAIVHQGGVGTTAQALRAGKPMIVMPYSHDQPDNARRVRRLGVAKVVQRKNYTAERAAKMLADLLSSSHYTERAVEVQRAMATEDGLKTACDSLEKLIVR
jgi:UDP:flavonoid glycosyltransferase YjiC (YdhE family)